MRPACRSFYYRYTMMGRLFQFYGSHDWNALSGSFYLPETERASHYFYARLADQFDAVLHFDRTRAVEPLDRTAGWKRGELPETFPTGL